MARGPLSELCLNAPRMVVLAGRRPSHFLHAFSGNLLSLPIRATVAELQSVLAPEFL